MTGLSDSIRASGVANKIVLVKKGKREGVEFPLDADTGTNGRGICHDGDDSFWVLLTGTPVTVRKYRIDRKSSSAKYTGKGYTIGGVFGYGICTDGASLYVARHTSRAGVFNKTIAKIDRETGEDLQLFIIATFSGLDTNAQVLDLGFDGKDVWYGFVTGAIGATHRMRLQNVSKNPKGEPTPTFNFNSLVTSHRGIAPVKGGSGIWWADADGGANYKLIHPVGFTVADTIPLTHSGTVRGMDDTGPLLAFMFN